MAGGLHDLRPRRAAGRTEPVAPQTDWPGSCPWLSRVTTIYTLGKGQSAANNSKVSHAITGNIVNPGLLKFTANRIRVCRGTSVTVSVFDTTGGATNTARTGGISCNTLGCTVTNLQATEKYISRSADGKDTDRMTFVVE